MSAAVYRRRGRLKRWAAFAATVIGLTLFVMLLGVLGAAWLAEPPETPAPSPSITRTEGE